MLPLDADGNFGENKCHPRPFDIVAAVNPGAGPLWREFLRRSRDVGTASKLAGGLAPMKTDLMPHACAPSAVRISVLKPHFFTESGVVRAKEARR